MSKLKFLYVIPCYNEEENINSIFKSILENTTSIENYEADFCFVDDGSTDNSWPKIIELHNNNNNVYGIKLSKNFGKESAIDAGLNFARENYSFYIIIDADNQHPTNKIISLIETYEKEKLDIVNTHRIDKNEGFLRETFSKLFYFLLRNFSEIKIISKTTDFMLLNKKVRNEFIKIKEINKTFRILINWMGFKKKSIPIVINKRYLGKSKFSFLNLTRMALNTLYSFSIIPIKVVGYFGVLMSILSFVSLMFVLINLIFGLTIITWQTVIILILILLSGLTMTSVGLLGIYVYKILNYTNKRPNFIIDTKL
jgi:glycosyltransferase involved in cell wall biosynthesis